jgi:putative oxidoreductase
MNRTRAPITFLARLLLAYIFLIEGLGTLAAYSLTQRYMEEHGILGSLLPFVIVTELGAGALVAIGLLTRLASLALAGFCVLTALLFHADWADAEQVINFNKNIAMAGGFLVLVAAGAGAWSLDALCCVLWRDQ